MAGPPRLPRERVRAFWRARIEGLTIKDAAHVAGVSQTGAESWITESGGMIPADVDLPPSGRYLSLAEREEIAHGWSAGLSRAQIARQIGRHPATVGRELVRNQRMHPSRTRATPRWATASPRPGAGQPPRPRPAPA
jgi:transposase, IS30 family